MSGLYKNESERMADALLTNASLDLRWVPTTDGKVKLVASTPMEKEVLREMQSESLARLAVDRAMR